MICVTFATDRYADELARLLISSARVGFEVEYEMLPEFPTWDAACRFKPVFLIARRLARVCGPLLWVDADGEFLARPVLPPEAHAADVGVHFHPRGDGYPSPGTLLVNDTPAAWSFLLEWNELSDQTETDQSTFNRAVERVPGLRVWEMPTSWCYIEGIDFKPDEVVIQHHQASRRLRNP